MSSIPGSSAVEEGLRCPLCLDFAKDAQETQCCKQIFCKKCLEQLPENKCPCCDSSVFLKYDPSIVAQRLINSIRQACPNNCGEYPSRVDIDKHLQICPRRVYQCVGKECAGVEGLEGDFIKHLIDVHKRRVINSALEWLSEEGENTDGSMATKELPCPEPSCDFTGNGQTFGQHLFVQHGDDLKYLSNIFIGTQPKLRNQAGSDITMGRNGKFYCKKKLNNGYICEPSVEGQENQPNCGYCMKIDMSIRQLAYGQLVNRDGQICDLSKPCLHGVKHNGTVSSRSRPCSIDICGHEPQYNCNRVFETRGKMIKCAEKITCEACTQIRSMFDAEYKSLFQSVFEGVVGKKNKRRQSAPPANK